MEKGRHRADPFSLGISVARKVCFWISLRASFQRMRHFLLSGLIVAAATLALSSCSDTLVPVATLSPSEQGLLNALNQHRSELGKKALAPTETLTGLAREDAGRRVSTDGSYADNRIRTGYERMLTLAGKAKSGDNYGDKLLGYWLAVPQQKQWLESSYANIGVGTAKGKDELETGVLLLGGF